MAILGKNYPETDAPMDTFGCQAEVEIVGLEQQLYICKPGFAHHAFMSASSWKLPGLMVTALRS